MFAKGTLVFVSMSSLPNMIVVTGGADFVGSNIVKELNLRGVTNGFGD
jgi:nucleoside-diphosphate-sugar epimerase